VTAAPGDSVIGRVDTGDSRYYVDPADPDVVLHSVTTVLGATEAKPWLAPWEASIAARFAVDNLAAVAELAENDPAAAVKWIRDEAKRIRDIASDIGTHQHNVFEAILLGAQIPGVPPHLVDVEIDGERVDHEQWSEGLWQFIRDFRFVPEMAEATVANPRLGYAGTLDAVGAVKRLGLGLVDVKSGKHVGTSARPQLSGYDHATEVWVDHLGNKARMPRVKWRAVLHLRPEYRRGYKLRRVDDDPAEWRAAWRRFRLALDLYRQQQGDRFTGSPLYPPLPDGSQPLPLLEDLDSDGLGRCVGPLAKVGVDSVSMLARLTARQVEAVKGIGPKSMVTLHGVLGLYGLEFAEEKGVA